MSKSLARELKHPRARVDREDCRTRSLGDVVGKLPFSATDIQDPFPVDPIDEEIVIAREPMLRMDALVIDDRSEVDADIGILVGLEEAAHRPAAVRVNPECREPEPKERAPDGERE